MKEEKKQLKILMLEDSPADAGLIQHRLKQDNMSFTIKVIDSVRELKHELSTDVPDVILSDHSLPGFNSFDALQICKQYNYKCPFILVTGTVSEEFAAESIKNGADDYILKDKLTRLPSAIKNSLAKKEAERHKEYAQNNLHEQNVFMNLLLETLPIAHYLRDAADIYNFSYMSGTFYSFTGFTPATITEDPSFWKARLHPDDLKKIEEATAVLLEEGEAGSEYRWKIADGNYKWFYDRAKIVITKGGKHIAGAIIDITSRKEAENRLVEINKELNTFIYRSTHDLRGPLTSIIGIINLAKAEKDLNQLKMYVNMIGDATQKLDDILLSLVSTMSIKNAPLLLIPINFENLLDGILKGMTGHDGFQRIKFTRDIKINTTFLSDEHIVRSILQNVIENAVKYHGKFEEPQIEVTVEKVQNDLIIEIKDNGIGISENIQARVFEMFFRGNNGSKGSGLGLYIAKNCVEKLGGTISLQSREHNGAIFRIALPFRTG